MEYYLFNSTDRDATGGSAPRGVAGESLGVGMWGVEPDAPYADVLAAGDLVLIYLGAPERVFIARAALASGVHRWSPSEARLFPGRSACGVSLAGVERWDPPVPMEAVLARIDPSMDARSDFAAGVVQINAHEYGAALAVAGELT